ncbi:MAG TPA: aminoacyl-tRNA hydrolase [Pirellulales bacterium]|nr:aminoacyl-tRNA hydrolase [Pirellulales bacterium]
MKLVVGLGNPGRKYVGTRHNVGFVVLGELARRFGASKAKSAVDAEWSETLIGSEKTLLVWPQTFMNLSGSAVLRLRDFYKLSNEELLVVCDDFHLPLGKLRMRGAGSAGGQKGLADILRRLGTEGIARLRIGIGTPPPGFETADFVLSKFRREESAEIDLAVQRAADAASDWITLGLASAMNKYNGE